MSTVGVKNPIYHPLFITMCPTYAYIDRADGKFNRAMGFMKDYSALIAAAWDIDTVYDAYLTDPDQGSSEMLAKLGLEDSDETDDMKNREEVYEALLSDGTHGNFKDRYISPIFQY